MNDLALIFKFKDIISGPSFQAGIQVEGRVLLTQEAEDGGEFWMYGVSPGGLAEHGETPEQAYGAFRRFFKGILEDFAEESSSLAEFKAAVQAFVCDVHGAEAVRWEAARLSLQKDAKSADDVFANTPKLAEAGTPGVLECVELKDGKVVTPPVKQAPLVEQMEATKEGLALAA